MKKILFAGLAIILSLNAETFAQKNKKSAEKNSSVTKNSTQEIQVSVDLLNVKNDRVKIIVTPPPTKEKQLTYVLPRTIPGTYDDYNFGRFIIDVAAYDTKGNFLPTARLGKNEVVITNADMLARLEYYANDTWDDDDSTKYIFQPAGANFDAGELFVVSSPVLFGYFEGMKNLPYRITYTKPSSLFGATALEKKTVNDTTDIMIAKNYPHLVDSPTFFSKPDTASFMAGKTKINISVVSPNKFVTAKIAQQSLEPIVRAEEKFFGTLPVDHYTFLMYFADLKRKDILKGRGFGAHEHSYSSVYFLPEYQDRKTTDDMIRNAAVHEFLHIKIPLNLHSEEIGNFDFKDPKMSQHLWLYEGTTEYFSLLAQLQGGLIDSTKFIQEIRQRIGTISRDSLLSLTEMSKRVMEPAMQEEYPSIYMRGAIVAMMLDLRLRELSRSKMTLLDLVNKLTEIYGPNKPFKDEELFSVIEKITFPEIGDFFRRYVIGTEQLPYEKFLRTIGWNFYPEKESMGYSFGAHQVYGVSEKGFFIAPAEGGESRFGVMRGDRLVAVNGQEITMDEAGAEAVKKMFAPADSSEVTITVERKGEMIKLPARPVYTSKKQKNFIEADPNASTEAITIRRQLFYGKPAS